MDKIYKDTIIKMSKYNEDDLFYSLCLFIYFFFNSFHHMEDIKASKTLGFTEWKKI